MIIIFSTLPIFPLISSCLIELCPGSYLLLKPNCILGWYFLISLKHLLTLSMFKSKGFSQKTTFLCFAASFINLIWVEVLEAINIKSIFLSLKAFSGVLISTVLNFFEIFYANFLLISKVYFNLKLLWFIKFSACIWPILPRPSNATFIWFLPIFYFLMKPYMH